MNFKYKNLYNIFSVILTISILLTGFASCTKPNKLNKNKPSFYNKLINNEDVSILIIGDSIGFGTGTETNGKEWFSLLENFLEKEYKNNVTIKNVSLNGGTSYTSYYNTELTDYYNLKNHKSEKYDLAIICCGHNDSEKDFSKYYETIIRSVLKKYSEASIISILQSSQRTYTFKVKEIEKLCDYYNIPTVDMIKPFKNKHKELTIDYVHPNDKGQKFYFENISRAIKNFTKRDIKKPIFKEPINKDALTFTDFKFFPPEKFKRTNDLTYSLNIKESGALGIDYFVKNQDSKAKIYIDGKLFYAPVANIVAKEYKRNVVLVTESCNIKNNIKLIFESKEQADLFKGIAISKNK